MIGELRSQLPDTLFIILTGYNEFEYAQRAIHYGGVHDFLLKPLQYDNSFPVIEKCIEKIRLRQLALQTLDPLAESAPNEENGNSIHLSDKDQDLQLFTQIEAYIKEHMDQELTLNRVAEHFFYNPSYLSRLFKAKLDKNYMTFVSEIRIQHAQQCLEIPQHSVMDVSVLCGYKSYKHFVKVFKSVTQMTPTDYRKQLRL